MATSWTFEEASTRLYQALKEYRDAKATLRRYREEHGSCEVETPDAGDETVHPCFRDTHWGPLPFDEWCDVCRGSQPLWQAYRAAATRRGAALRTFMAVGQRTQRRAA